MMINHYGSQPGRPIASHVVAMLFQLFLACSGLFGSIVPAHASLQAAPVVFTFDFEDNATEWVGGFADYPAGEEAFYELGWDWRPLAAPLSGHGLFITGNNHSDDLFMFFKRRIGGLKPNTFYLLTFQLELGSNAASGCGGVGGPPGEGVAVKAGASQGEPISVLDQAAFYRMSIDKGNQGVGGRDAIILGTIANGQTDCLNPVYTRIVRENTAAPFLVLADQSGMLWIIVGTDSGFEATTSLYYDKITIQALEVGTYQRYLPLLVMD